MGDARASHQRSQRNCSRINPHLRLRRSALSRPAFLTGVRNERGVPDVAWFARARLNLLSLEPSEWTGRVTRWSKANASFRQGAKPDAIDEWLIYQTLFGAWPITTDRLRLFVKALREAKRYTQWERPNEAYETAILDFAEALLEDPDATAFRLEMDALVVRTALAARYNGLAQTVLQLTLPGIPDLYQGTEFWTSPSLIPTIGGRSILTGWKRH